MLALLSPAKSLDFETPFDLSLMSQARLLDQSAMLARKLRTLSRKKIAAMMSLSEALAELNYQRFQTLDLAPDADGQKSAILAFAGDVYVGLDANSLELPQLLAAQDRLRILSGLYGLLRPLDGIQPYRLEMGRSLTTTRGKTLYAFWGSRITQLLEQDVQTTNSAFVINLASQEYFKAVKPQELSVPVVTPDFKEWRDGRLTSISFSAKRARGLMARYMLVNDVRKPEDLKEFQIEGYRFDPEASRGNTWIFAREDQRAVAA